MPETVKKDTNVEQGATPEYIKRVAEEVGKLVKDGKSVEEALLATQHLLPNSRVIGNRIEFIRGLNSIAEVDKANHTAHAKLSKSRKSGNQESIARYMEEIKVSGERKNFLEAQISQAKDQFAAAVQLGASESGLVQMLIAQEEAKAKDILDQAKSALNWTNKGLKAQVNAQDTATPEWFIQRLGEIHPNCVKLYEDRRTGGDKRVETLNRRFNLIESLKAKVVPKTDVKVEVPVAISEDIKKMQDEVKAKAEVARAKVDAKLMGK